MNVYSATFNIFRRFAALHRAPRTIEKRTYVFILVPFNFHGNGHAKRADVVQPLIDIETESNRRAGESAAANARVSADAITECDEPQLDYNLMWTWLLPNPLWPPKQRK
jgi:hypothetical protein